MTEYEEDCKKLRECIEWFTDKYICKKIYVRTEFCFFRNPDKVQIDKDNYHRIGTDIDIENIISY